MEEFRIAIDGDQVSVRKIVTRETFRRIMNIVLLADAENRSLLDTVKIEVGKCDGADSDLSYAKSESTVEEPSISEML